MYWDVTYVLTILMVMSIYVYKADGFLWPTEHCGHLSVKDPVHVDKTVTLEFKPGTYSRNSTIQWHIKTGGIVGQWIGQNNWKPLENSTEYTIYNAKDGSVFYMKIAGNNRTKLQKVYVTFYKDGTTEKCDSATVRFKRQYEMRLGVDNTTQSSELVNTDEDLVEPQEGSGQVYTTWSDDEEDSHIEDNITMIETTSDINGIEFDLNMSSTTAEMEKYEEGSSQIHFMTSTSSPYSADNKVDMSSTSEPTTMYRETTLRVSNARPDSKTTARTGMNRENMTKSDDAHGKVNTTPLYKDTDDTKTYVENNDFEKDATTHKSNATERKLDYPPKHEAIDKDKVTHSQLNNFTDTVKQTEKVSGDDGNAFNFLWVIVGGAGVVVIAITIVAVIVIKRKRKAKHCQSAVKYVASSKREDMTVQNGSVNGHTCIGVDRELDGDSRCPVSNGRQPNDAPVQLPQVHFNLQPLASTTVPR